MANEKSSLVPRLVAGVLLLLLVAGVLYFALRPSRSGADRLSAKPSAAAWDRRITVSGDAGASFRCWLNYRGSSVFQDLKAPAVVDVPHDVGSVEIRLTGATGRIDLKVENGQGRAATASLAKQDEFIDLIILDSGILWSKDHVTVAELKF